MDGIINVYKEKGYTSHDVVAKLRGILRQKKIGHTGTLDPDAEGVLPVCLGKATKLCDMLTDKDKTYQTILKLGITTDTQDMTGTIIEEKQVHFNSNEIKECILSFVGQYEQTPPMYSALKVNGKKLYELARQGIEVERKARTVYINDIEILSIDEINHEISMEVSCSKGTYIRTLCNDIGDKLGCGGCMKQLLRTKVSQFSINNSMKLTQIEALQKENKLEAYLLNIETVFLAYPKVMVLEEFNKLVYNGNVINETHTREPYQLEDGCHVRIYDSNDHFIGIYSYASNLYKPVKMFL